MPPAAPDTNETPEGWRTVRASCPISGRRRTAALADRGLDAADPGRQGDDAGPALLLQARGRFDDDRRQRRVRRRAGFRARLCAGPLHRRAVRPNCATSCSSGSGRTRRARSPKTCSRRLHQLSLRFHLGRRTGAVTKVVERGTKSIDIMLYFLLFNLAPTHHRTERGGGDLLPQFRHRPGRRDGR